MANIINYPKSSWIKANILSNSTKTLVRVQMGNSYTSHGIDYDPWGLFIWQLGWCSVSRMALLMNLSRGLESEPTWISFTFHVVSVRVLHVACPAGWLVCLPRSSGPLQWIPYRSWDMEALPQGLGLIVGAAPFLPYFISQSSSFNRTNGPKKLWPSLLPIYMDSNTLRARNLKLRLAVRETQRSADSASEPEKIRLSNCRYFWKEGGGTSRAKK